MYVCIYIYVWEVMTGVLELFLKDLRFKCEDK